MSHPIIRVQLENSVYNRLAEEAIQYALISLPYTINRMKLQNVESRILNIAKGKLSENIFFTFCNLNEIPISLNQCSTPFYEPDKRDFILGREEWDIKNNFIYKGADELSVDDYLNLPALIPNRGQWDQWTKKDHCIHEPITESVCFLFSFMNGVKDGTAFLSISLTQEQLEFLIYLMKSVGKYDKPFKEKWFWQKMKEKGQSNSFLFELNFHPELIICGMAQPKDFSKFQSIAPQSFQGGLFKTRIKNQGVPMNQLTSFVHLYPGLIEKMKSGTLMS